MAGSAIIPPISIDSVAAAAVARAMDVPLGSATRPAWRGRLHLVGLTAAVPLTVVVAILAAGARARSGAIVYAVGLCTMFAVSVTYHRWVHSSRARAGWRRADHAAIFAAIAGTFTPLCLLALSGVWGVAVLTIVWAAALVGATMKAVNWRHAHGVGAFLYIAIGWCGIVLVPAMWNRSGWLPVALLIAGGVVYTAGAIGFARQWPRLRPTVFSYHEVWHGYTLVAAGLHLAAVWVLAT